MASEQYHDVYKIVLLGDASVGKTNIMNNFTKGSLTTPKGPTLGIQYASKTVFVDTHRAVKLQIWDTAGQEAYRSMTTTQLKKAIGAIVVFDITNRNSFNSVTYWLKEIHEKALQNIQVIIVGNKVDKAENRVVYKQQGQDLANKLGASYEQTSCNDLNSLNWVFKQIAKKISFKNQQQQNINFSPDKNLHLKDNSPVSNTESEPNKKCC